MDQKTDGTTPNMLHGDEASNNPVDMQDVDGTSGQEKDGGWFEVRSPDAPFESDALTTLLPDTLLKSNEKVKA